MGLITILRVLYLHLTLRSSLFSREEVAGERRREEEEEEEEERERETRRDERESGSGARGLSVRTQRSGRRRRKEEKEKDVLRRPAVLSTSTDEETTRVCEKHSFGVVIFSCHFVILLKRQRTKRQRERAVERES